MTGVIRAFLMTRVIRAFLMTGVIRAFLMTRVIRTPPIDFVDGPLLMTLHKRHTLSDVPFACIKKERVIDEFLICLFDDLIKPLFCQIVNSFLAFFTKNSHFLYQKLCTILSISVSIALFPLFSSLHKLENCRFGIFSAIDYIIHGIYYRHFYAIFL